ncbi:MAG: ANTAR domain-containing protein [Treponema sp.]|nr:ANTAR domain-containing protein [Treponema sp.]
MSDTTHSVLVVTKDSKISSMISALLIAPLFETNIVSDFNEARRRCLNRVFNIILVDYSDGDGCDFAIDISASTSTILLLTPNSLFDQVSYKVEGYGILTITKDFDQFYFYNMIKVAIAVQYKTTILSSQTTKLKVKMEEIRVISRAKMLLMQTKSFTEEEAHHYIEKEAMNSCKKKIDIAKEIIGSAV